MYALEKTLAIATLLALGAAQRASGVAFYNPALGGGSMLDNSLNGYGEPLNVIISGESSPDVLTDDGFLNYARAIGFSTECLGIHVGAPFSANLGDGNGWANQTMELREDYVGADAGTCLEALVGGNHFRVFRQNGPLANSGALFLAVSQEESAADNHNIVPDGYDVGRDKLVASTGGEKSYAGVTYSTQAQSVTGLLPPGSEGINHGIAQDGIVALLTVTIV